MNDLRDGGEAASQAGQGKRIKSDGQLVKPGQLSIGHKSDGAKGILGRSPADSHSL